MIYICILDKNNNNIKHKKNPLFSLLINLLIKAVANDLYERKQQSNSLSCIHLTAIANDLREMTSEIRGHLNVLLEAIREFGRSINNLGEYTIQMLITFIWISAIQYNFKQMNIQNLY